MRSLLRPFRSLWRRLCSSIWTWRGRRRLAAGDSAGAISCLNRALDLGGRRFAPLLHLSRAYLRRRDLETAFRLLQQAQVLAPRRFLRTGVAWLHREGYTLADVMGSADPRRGLEPAAARVQAPGRRAARRRAAPEFGDCRDLDEYARFRAMPPISRAEVEETDWDRVIDDLLDD